MRSLYDRGKSCGEIRQMFRVIDWMMDLPPELATQFRTPLEQIEVEKKMPYLTSVERTAKEEGILIGQILLLQKQLRDEAIMKSELALEFSGFIVSQRLQTGGQLLRLTADRTWSWNHELLLLLGD